MHKGSDYAACEIWMVTEQMNLSLSLRKDVPEITAR